MARRIPDVGEIGMRYGRRNYLRTKQHLLLAKRANWHLVICPDKCMDGWINLRLHLDQPAKKNSFEIGVFDGKAAPKVDVQLLNENHPKMMAWVMNRVAAYVDGKITLKPEAGTPVIYTRGRRWKLLHKG
jgi:hypothetical protein